MIMRIVEDTFKRFRRNNIDFLSYLKDKLNIGGYYNRRVSIKTDDGENFRISVSFPNKGDMEKYYHMFLDTLKDAGAKKIRRQGNQRSEYGYIDFFIPKSAQDVVINEFEAKEDERENAYKASIDSVDISSYLPSEKILDKIRNYRDNGSKINTRAIKDLNKALTYLCASLLLNWDKAADDLEDRALELGADKTLINAICEKTEIQERDERDVLDKKKNLPKNDVIQYSDEIRKQKGTWLPRSILKFFIDNNIPVRFDNRSYGGDYDRNGLQWSERVNFTVYPDTDHEKKDHIVVNTLESGGPTKYSYGWDTRVSAKKVIDALADRYLREGFNESVKSDNDILPEISGINISSNKFSDTDRAEISETIKRLANGDEYARTDAVYYRDSGLGGFSEQADARKSVISGIKSALKANNITGVRVTTSMERVGRDSYEYWVTIKPTSKFRVGGRKEVDESLNESNDEDMGYKLGKWLGARLLTGWTAMLNVDGAEESPDYDEYDQQFDGTFVQCLNKLKEYQDIIDQDGIDAYLALQSSHGEYFDGDYDRIIDKLYDRGYLYEDDMDESLNESKNTSLEEIKEYFDSLSDSRNLPDYSEWSLKELTDYYTKFISMLKECKRRVKEINAQVDEEGTRDIAFSIADALASHGYNYDYYDFNDSFDSFSDAVNSIYDNFDKDTIQACIDDLTDEIEDIKRDPAYGGKPFPASPLRTKRSDYADWKKFRKFEESVDESADKPLNEFYDKGWQETGRGWSSDTYRVAEKVYEFLRDNDIWTDIYDYNPDYGEFSLEINGDWKHEHLRADWLIKEKLKEVNGFRIENIGEYSLADSMDDSYRGVHQYRITNVEEENKRQKEMQERKKKFEDSLVKKEVNGKERYVSPDGKMFTKGYFSDSPDEIIWFEVNESLNEDCNSYQYKGKTIINAGDYWFVKGFKEKFPTSDEAEEFIDDNKKDENFRVNIRESLNKMDVESDNTYDLLNLYESKNLSKRQKKDIARMIYENYGLEKIYNYLYEATEESEDELPVEDRVKELTNDFKNTNGSYVFEDGQDANKAISILKSRGYEASQKRTQDGKYRVTADKKNK
jgi:hypothetical protein